MEKEAASGIICCLFLFFLFVTIKHILSLNAANIPVLIYNVVMLYAQPGIDKLKAWY